MRRAVPALLLLLAATAPAMPNGARLEQRQRAQAETADEILIYRTKAGETLTSIAGKWFVNAEDWRRAMALNKLKDGDKVPAGTALKLRASWLKTNPITAELVAFRGDVRVLRKDGAVPVAKGMELAEGDVLITGPNGFATLGLPDNSHVSLPSASRIRLARLRQVPMSDSIDRRFTLEQGRSEARVTPMANPASRFLITTPVAVAAVRGTQFKVSYTPEEFKATTVVTEGKVSVSRIGGIEDVLVRAGFGNLTTAKGATAAAPLLPAPAVDTPDRVQNSEVVTFRLKPVPGAVRYLVEIATDADFVDRVASVEADGAEAAFRDVPNGDYHVRAFAIDSRGLEGMPADTKPFKRSWAGQVNADAKRAADKRREQVADLGSGDGADFNWFANDAGAVVFAAQGGGAAADGSLLFQPDGGALSGDEPIIPIDDAGLLDVADGGTYAVLMPLNGETRPGGGGSGNGGGFGGGDSGSGGSGGGSGGGGASGGGSGGGGGGSSTGGAGNGASGGGADSGSGGAGSGGSGPGGSGPGGSGSGGSGSGAGGSNGVTPGTGQGAGGRDDGTGTGGNGAGNTGAAPGDGPGNGSGGNGGSGDSGTPAGNGSAGNGSAGNGSGGNGSGGAGTGGNGSGGTPGGAGAGDTDGGGNGNGSGGPVDGGLHPGGNSGGGNTGGNNGGGSNTGGGTGGGSNPGENPGQPGGPIVIPLDPEPPVDVPTGPGGVNPGNGGIPGRNDGAGVNAIPEPATWLMLIGGFGLVGVAIRRRRRAAAA